MNAIDTNVLVYAVDRAEPEKQAQAIALLDELAFASIQTVLLWQVAVEFLSCMRRWETVGRVKRDDSRAYLQQFDRMFECVYPVREVLDRALDLSERYSLSHWDSLLLGACCHVGVETLYTEDLDENTSYASLSVVNPFS